MIIVAVGTQSGVTTDINTTASETDLLNYTVPGGSMCVNGQVKFLIWGYLLANSGSPTYTFKIKLGTTVLITYVTGSFGASATKMPFRIEGEVTNKNATNAQAGNVKIYITDTTPTTNTFMRDSEGSDTTKDTTVDQVLQVTVTMSVNNSAVHTVVKHKKVEVFQHG
jgi:hypothetical protein